MSHSSEFLFDASALYSLMDYVDRIDFKKSHILTLTFYEVGNAIWKSHYLQKKVKDPVTLAILFHRLMRKFNVIDDPPLEGVMRVAVERGLTYYDASYAYVAGSFGLTLVSKDRDLIEKAGATSLEDFVKFHLT